MKNIKTSKIKKIALASMMLGLLGAGTVYGETLGVSTGTHVNIRQEPNTSCQVLGQVNVDDELIIKGKSDDWYHIDYQGADAWIYGAYVSILDQEESEELQEIDQVERSGQTEVQQPSKGEQIVAYAKQFMGVPYVWGGTNLNRGVDCSGFTQSVMKHFGIYLNRVSHDQVYNGSYVEKSKLQPGDLVFFDTHGSNNGVISHVGIYIGNGQFIQSSSASGRGVVISNLNKGYYNRTYVKGVRVIKEG